MTTGYRWLGKTSDIQPVQIGRRHYIKFTHLVAGIIKQFGEISRKELINILVDEHSYARRGASYLIADIANGLSDQYAIEIVRYPSQLQQLIKETGLSKTQFTNYRVWLTSAGIFPSHKEARDTYSSEERTTLRKIGAYMKSGRKPLDSIRLAVRDVFGESKVEDFNFRFKKCMEERELRDREKRVAERLKKIEENFPNRLTLVDYSALVRMYDDRAFRLLSNMHYSILERLVKEFLGINNEMLRSYPLNLYFAVSRIVPQSYIRNRLDNLMSSIPKQRNFQDYRNDIFGKLIHSLEELSARSSKVFEIGLSGTMRINRSMEMLRARYIETGALRSLEEVGQEKGITKERVRQLEAKALRQLRNQDETRALIELFLK